MNRLLRLAEATQSIRTSAGVGLLLFIASAIVSTWTSYDPTLGQPILLTILASIGLFLVIITLPLRWTAWAVVFMAGLIALYFVSQYAHFYYPYEKGRLARLGRITGALAPNLVFFTPHPNAVATFLEGGFLLSLVVTWQIRGHGRWVWLLLPLIIAYALFISASRGAWFGLMVAISLWILLRFPQPLPRLISIGAGMTVTAGVGLITMYGLARSLGRDVPLIWSFFRTAASRLELYQSSLLLLTDYPFSGVGLGETFAMVYSRYQLLINVPFFFYAHNLYLAVGVGQGIGGLIALGLMIFVFYRFVFRVEKQLFKHPLPNTPSLPIFRTTWLGVTASLIHGLTDATQLSADSWTMFMIFALAGLTVTAGRAVMESVTPQQMAKPNIIRHPHIRPFANFHMSWGRGVAIGLIIIIAIFFWRPVVGAWYANLGAIRQTRAELLPYIYINEATQQKLLTEASAYFEHALAVNPTQASANRRLGIIALDRDEFEQAIIYLERAYRQEPYNQNTIKLLGYAYLWTGQIDRSQHLFQQVRFRSRLISELRYSRRQFARQGREDLSDYAGEMANRLAWR